MTRICFISPEYVPLSGGTGAYVYYLSRELMRNGFNVDIVTGSDQARDIKVDPQLQVYFLKIPKTPIVKSFTFAGNSLRKLSSLRENADVDITHVNLPLVPNFAVPSSFGRAILCTVHSTWKGEANAIHDESYSRLNANEKFMVSFNWFLRIFEVRMLERANKIIAVSNFTRLELLNYYKIKENKIRVIHNGVDIEKFKPAEDKRRIKKELGFDADDIAILSVGRLYARKGLFTLIESMPAIIHTFPNAKFIISGKGQSNETKKLKAYANGLGVENNIIFTGYYPDNKLPKLYQAADVFAFSTFYEHHPFAILEAMSTGLPIVTNNIGGIPETIENNRNGLLCQPFNPQQFSERILYYLEHPSEAVEMGFRARKTIEERFDWRIVVKKVLAVYNEVLS